jgi:hypothetical protein
VIGDVSVTRRYYACRHCRESQVPWDAWAGVGDRDHLTAGARRLAVLAGSSWSFDVASDRLQEFCGLRISDQTLRRVTEAAGAAAGEWQKRSPAATTAYREASGHSEFYTDGTCVNTTQGWREMRLGIFAKRLAGAPATPEQWADRVLPASEARAAFGGMIACEAFGTQWSVMAERLGLARGRGVSCLGDGAKWIWRQVAEHLPESECVVDVFHVSEHLHECGRVLHGDQTEAARGWGDAHLLALITDGPMRFLSGLEAKQRAAGSSEGQQALEAVANYLKPNIDGLWYADRLRRGLPIGSGMVEGACKNVIGRRMKSNSARWTPEHADQMAALLCLQYSTGQWEAFWRN